MKIYSLQEDNERQNALRGITPAYTARTAFETAGRDTEARGKKLSSSAGRSKGSFSPVQPKRPAPSAGQRNTVPSAPQQRRAVPSAQPQKTPPQKRSGQRAMLIFWLIFMLLIVGVNALLEFLQ